MDLPYQKIYHALNNLLIRLLKQKKEGRVTLFQT